jgi:zinc transport system substrate-binding protein
MNKNILIFFIISLFFLSCGKEKSSSDVKTLTVSILPQKYFVEQIAGDKIDVQVMIPPGANPVSYDPSPRQLQKLSQSHAYLKIGYLAFENVWLPKMKSTNKDMEVWDQSLNVDLIKTHSHHHGHHKRGIDPHIWTSPKSVKKQVKLIYRKIVKLDKEDSVFYRKNYHNFLNRIDSLDVFIEKKFDGIEDRSFMIFHPSLSYLSRDYKLNQIPIEIEGKEPSPSKLKEIIDKAKQHQVHSVFIQEQFDTHSAEVIAKELDGNVIIINPLNYEWLKEMKDITNKLSKTMQR